MEGCIRGDPPAKTSQGTAPPGRDGSPGGAVGRLGESPETEGPAGGSDDLVGFAANAWPSLGLGFLRPGIYPGRCVKQRGLPPPAASGILRRYLYNYSLPGQSVRICAGRMFPTSRISPDVAYLFRTFNTARATLSGSTSGSFRKAAAMCEKKSSISLSWSGFPLGLQPS